MKAVIFLTLACIAMLASNAEGFFGQFGGLPMGGGQGLGLGQGQGQGLLSGEQTKCFQSFLNNNMGSCLQDLATGFQTQKITMSAQCCSYVTSLHSACVPVVYFQNPLFQKVVQQHCSGSSSGAASGRKSMPAASGSGAGAMTGSGSAVGSGAGAMTGSGSAVGPGAGAIPGSGSGAGGSGANGALGRR